MKKNLPVPLQVVVRAWEDWWDDWIGMVLVNLAWVLCWTTIVLGPPATLGIYYVTNRLAHGDSVGLSGLIEGVRRYFLKSWGWFFLTLSMAMVAWANIWFYGLMGAAWARVLQGIFLMLGLVWLIVQFYTLPYLIEQDQKHLKQALRNSLFTFLAAPGYTLVMIILAATITVLSVTLVFPLFFGGPCLIAALGNRAVMERLEIYRVREREAGGQEYHSDEP